MAPPAEGNCKLQQTTLPAGSHITVSLINGKIIIAELHSSKHCEILMFGILLCFLQLKKKIRLPTQLHYYKNNMSVTLATCFDIESSPSG